MGFNVKFEEFHTGCQKSISLQIEKYWLADGVCFLRVVSSFWSARKKRQPMPSKEYKLFRCMLGGMSCGKLFFFFETDSFLSIKISELDIVSVTRLISRD